MSDNINSEEVQAAEPAVESVTEAPVSATPSPERPPRENRPERTDRPRSYSGGGSGSGGDERYSKFKRKVCRFCADKSLPIDYKRADILERFITDRGKILPRRVTGTCAKHQRSVALAIKQARIIALLPFLEK